MAVSRVTLVEGGPEVSRIIYGCWRLLEDPRGSSPDVVLEKIDACLSLGITTFDHADIYGGYGCEKVFGDALRQRPGLAERIEVVTKCGIALVTADRPGNRVKHYDTSAGHIAASVERSLKNLAVESIDLLLLHRPDPLMDADETARALDGLCESGKVKHVGVSNFTVGQWDLLQSRLERPLVTNQVEVSVMALEALHDGTLDHCQRLAVRPMAWSPLGQGRLFDASDERAGRVRAALESIGRRYGATVEQLAHSWILRHPSRPTVILGSNRVERIRSAAESERWASMERQDWFAVWEASAGHRVP